VTFGIGYVFLKKFDAQFLCALCLAQINQKRKNSLKAQYSKVCQCVYIVTECSGCKENLDNLVDIITNPFFFDENFSALQYE